MKKKRTGLIAGGAAFALCALAFAANHLNYTTSPAGGSNTAVEIKGAATTGGAGETITIPTGATITVYEPGAGGLKKKDPQPSMKVTPDKGTSQNYPNVYRIERTGDGVFAEGDVIIISQVDSTGTGNPTHEWKTD